MANIKKIIKWVFLVAIIFTAIDAGVIFYFANTESNIHKSDAIIVMGAAINSPALYNRTLKALELYEAKQAPVMVLSGGRISEDDISEATYMQRVLQTNTESPLNIILEENSNSTYENIKYSKEKLEDANSIIIVTDKYHIARSVIMAKSEGFKEVMWATPDTKLSAKEVWYHYLREMAAMVSYVPKFVFN